MHYAPTPQDIANVCDADRHATGDVIARDEISVSDLEAAELLSRLTPGALSDLAREINAPCPLCGMPSSALVHHATANGHTFGGAR